MIKLNLTKITYFFVLYLLIFKNLLYASSCVEIFASNKETKLYNIDNDTVVIDIAKPNKNISFNMFKEFNTHFKRVLINNSPKETKSRFINKEIKPNQNYDNNHICVADTIIFSLPKEANISILSSTIEVLGSVNNFIFSSPSGIIS